MLSQQLTCLSCKIALFFHSTNVHFPEYLREKCLLLNENTKGEKCPCPQEGEHLIEKRGLENHSDAFLCVGFMPTINLVLDFLLQSHTKRRAREITISRITLF